MVGNVLDVRPSAPGDREAKDSTKILDNYTQDRRPSRVSPPDHCREAEASGETSKTPGSGATEQPAGRTA